jgi:hypothetical protein
VARPFRLRNLITHDGGWPILSAFFAKGEARKQTPDEPLAVIQRKNREAAAHLSYSKNKTPGRFGPGRNLSSYKLIIGKRGLEVEVT